MVITINIIFFVICMNFALNYFTIFIILDKMSEEKPVTNNQNANNKLEVQLKLIQKIVKSGLIASRHRFPAILIYQITKFVFKNPLRLRKSLYSPNVLNELRINNQYLFRRTNREQSHKNRYTDPRKNLKALKSEYVSTKPEQEKDKDKVWVSKDKNSNEYTASITITKNWKGTIVNESDYNEILQKARLFFVFLSNIKLFSANQTQKNNSTDPLKDYHNYQKRQKEISKYHYLICDNFQLYYSYFQQVFKYQKDKKINAIVIKAFINLMSKNMALVKIQQNYNTESLQCQGKYLYIQNKDEFPLKPKRIAEDNQFPSLRIENNQWIMVDIKGNYSFQVFQEVTYPLPWGRHNYWTRYMTITTQIDIWTEEEQNN